MGELNVSANVPGKGLVVDERGYQSAGLTRFQQSPGGATVEFQVTSGAEPRGIGTMIR
jgi:hypothetical protein